MHVLREPNLINLRDRLAQSGLLRHYWEEYILYVVGKGFLVADNHAL